MTRIQTRTATWLAFAATALLLIAKAMLARYLVVGETRAWAVVFEAAFVVLVLGAFDLALPRRRWLGYAFADLALSALWLMSVMYASYYGQVLTPAMGALAGQAGEVGSSIAGLMRPSYALLVADIPLLALALWLARGRLSAQRDRAIAAVTIASLVVSAGLVVSVVRIPGSVDGVTASRSRGLFAYQLASSLRNEEAAAGDVAIPAEMRALQADIASATPEAGPRVAGVEPGVAKGKNVIIVQVEALQGVVMGKRIDGREVTPNFNRFAQQSYYFPDTFSQIGKGNTSDAEFAVASSLYPPLEKAASIAYSNREISGLPRLLSAAGYKTFTFHTNSAQFWNRTQLYPALGYSRYYDRRFFGNADVVGMGPSDEVLYAKTLGVLKQTAETGRPFYAQLVTLTSHDPFDPMPAAKDPWVPPAPYGTTSTGRYLTRINYADRAFGEFIEDLKGSGLYDSSVIVVYGDHFALKHTETSGAEGDAQRALLGRTYTRLDRLRVPLMIHIPGQAGSLETTAPASQLDVMPTVAELVGVDASATPHFGRSVFSSQRPLFTIGSMPLGTFVNERVFFVPGLGLADGSAVRLSDGAPVSLEASEAADFAEVKRLRTLSAAYVGSLRKRAGASVDPHASIPAAF